MNDVDLPKAEEDEKLISAENPGNLALESQTEPEIVAGKFPSAANANDN